MRAPRPPVTEGILTARELNRATLARQLLLERVPMTPTRAIEQLAGLQAQHPASAYLALWTRLADFRAEAVDRAFRERRVVKGTLMRGTLHAVSARDLLQYWPAMSGMIGSFRDRTLKWPADAMPLDELTEQVLRFAAEPRTNVELREHAARLARKEGEREAWWGVRLAAPFVVVPTADPWSFGRRPVLAAARSWVGGSFATAADGLDHLVGRYLRAFGPATLADLGRWTSVDRTALKLALERLSPKLRRYRNEAGKPLFDIVGGALPPSDTPAPVRFLPMWDSVLLAYQDRSRMIPEAHGRRVVQANGDYMATFLVDGLVAGLWQAEAIDGRASIRLHPFEPLDSAVEEQLAEEARRLAEFIQPIEPDVYRSYAARWIGRWGILTRTVR